MGSLQVVQKFTEDALANQFQIIIPTFPGVVDLEQTNLRVTNLSIPEYTIGTYTITKKGHQFARRSGISTMPTEFTFTYRVDRNYDVYKGFIEWLKLGRNSIDGTMAAESTIRSNITAQPIDANNNILFSGWEMIGCFISSHDGLTFDEETGEPLTASVTMQMQGFNVISA